ncbi:MAG TPA: SpaA isopeptide-forming pilin-related protein, partial [Candidatus Limiplasma sp.]|nr:SpaA isopeptide-forming pilin-related protein [Candidatus Limiplasma sp.]
MAPSGYLTADPVTFTLSENGTIIGSATNRIAVTDLPVTVRFAKVDNLTGLPVAGAGFSVYDDAQWQQNAAAAVPVYTFTSNGSYVEARGVFTAGRLYRLVETSAPAGYQVNAASLQFRAPAENTTLTLRVTNPRVYQFQKLSSADGRTVTGAQLTVLDESGNTVIAPWYSGTTPYEFVNSDASGAPILKAGILYRLVELTAPAGYSLNTASVSFRLDQTGLINGGTSVTMYNTPTASPTPSTMDLTLRKTWRDHDNAGNTRPTGGLVVNVYRRPAGTGNYSLLVTVTIPYRNDNNWYLTLRNLPRYDNNGTEYLYMAREEVPAGYTVTYANNGFTMVNTYPDNNESPTPIPTLTPTPPAPTVTPYVPTNVAYVDGQWVYIDDNGVPLGVLPQTGDETSWTLLAIAIVAPLLLAGFAAWWIFRKKRRYAKR